MSNNLQIFQNWLYREYSNDVPEDILNLIEGEGIPKRWVVSASTVIHRLSEMPWCTQEDILNEISLTKAELITLNSFIRESDFLQDMIVYRGIRGTCLPPRP